MDSAENGAAQPSKMPHHERLESEAIHILPEAVAETPIPVMLFSTGKDSTVMAHPVVERDGASLVFDDPARMLFKVGETTSERSVRVRTLGCRPLTSAVESQSTDLSSIVRETPGAANSERQGRIGDSEHGGSLEQKKREGYW